MFASKLRQIKKDKLPPFTHLETYLIPPAEMAIQSQILFPGIPNDDNGDWNDWELSQTLAEEDEGYSAEFIEDAKIEGQLCSGMGAAVRNRHINAINKILKSNSMFLSGIFLPQTLWKDILDRIKVSNSEICMIYREDNCHLFIHHGSHGFPRMKWYQQRKCDENKPDKIENEAINNLAESLMYSLPYGNDGAHPPLYFFQDSFSQEETIILENKLGTSLNDISGDILPEKLYSPGQIEYLMPYCAHKKISDSITVSRTIGGT